MTNKLNYPEGAVDSYEEFLAFTTQHNDIFWRYAMNKIIQPDEDVVKTLWEELKKNIENKEKLTIRSYGRNGNNRMLYNAFYQDVFGISDINFDTDNNNAPAIIVQRTTGKTRGVDIINYQVSHIFGRTKNIYLFTAPWNISLVPKICDPFTGHETKGRLSYEFEIKWKTFYYNKYKSYIEEYNNFVLNQNIQERVRLFLDNIEVRFNVSSNVARNFRDSISKNFSEIRLDTF